MTEQLSFDDAYAPRSGPDPSPMGRLAERLDAIVRALHDLQRGAHPVPWSSVSTRPAWAGSDTSIAGSYINGAVAQADGSAKAFNNTVGGSTSYAVWVGDDGNYNFGRTTSSMKYKRNFRPVEADPLRVLNIEELIFDRQDQFEPPANGGIGPEYKRPGNKDEFGVLAEQVALHMPELVQYFDGEIDGVRYELIGLALVPVVRMHEGRIQQLETEIAEMRKRQDELERRMMVLETRETPTTPTPVTPTTPKGTS